MTVLPVHAETTGSTTGFSNGPTLDFPSSVAAGSLAVLIVDSARSGAIGAGTYPVVSDTEGGSWTEAYDGGSGYAYVPRGTAFWRACGPADADATVTVNFQSDTNYSVSLIVLTGADTSDPIGGVSNRQAGTSTSLAFVHGGKSTVAEGSTILAVAFTMTDQLVPFSTPTNGYTKLTDRYGANNFRNHATYWSGPLSIGTWIDPNNVTVGRSSSYATRAMEIKPAVAAVAVEEWDGSAWVDAAMEVWDGSAWVDATPALHDGSDWLE